MTERKKTIIFVFFTVILCGFLGWLGRPTWPCLHKNELKDFWMHTPRGWYADVDDKCPSGFSWHKVKE